MYRFDATVSLTDSTPMTAHQLIQAAIEARTYPSAQQKADDKSRFFNAHAAELKLTPIDDAVKTGAAFRRVTNGVCASDFDDADLTETVAANTQKVIRPCALSNQVFYQETGSAVEILFDVTLF